MSKKTIWTVRVKHILQAIEEIEEFTKNIKDEEDFYANTLIVRGVERCFQIIGEASKYVPDDVCARYTDIPWREIRAMRNFVVHEYDDVQKDILWDTVRKDLPPLKEKLEKLMRDCNENQ